MQLIEFLDVNVTGSGELGSIEWDSGLAAIANLKTTNGDTLVSHWFDPYPPMLIDDGVTSFIRDSASKGIMRTTNSQSLLTIGPGINGKDSFTLDTKASMQMGNDMQPINTERWTVLFVAHPTLDSNPSRSDIIGIGNGTLGENVVMPSISVESLSDGRQQLILRQGGVTTTRLVSVIDITTKPAVFAVSFSVEKGISSFKNKFKNLAENKTDKRPLTNGNFALFGNRTGAYPAKGNFGQILVLRDDISKPEYKYASDVILSVLINKYNITD